MLEAVEEVRGYGRLGDGRELTSASLLERFGFRGERARAFVRDLSGGERRRLQLMRLLMGEPNVLVLDEPTNDLDIDTLTALEDLLDGWPGTWWWSAMTGYFVERVCDDVYALVGDGSLRHLPGGIEQYLELRRPFPSSSPRGLRVPFPRKRSCGPRARKRHGSSAPSKSLPVRRRRSTPRWSRQPRIMCGWVSCRRLWRRTPRERERLEAAWLEAAEIGE